MAKYLSCRGIRGKFPAPFYRPMEMDKKLIQSYLDNIAELVVDDDKIVTYKSLSKSLKIHVNTAKQLLYSYLTQQKVQNAFPISATYLIAGKLADGSSNITIINENELEPTYQKFIEITSEHVYSIQKGKNMRDINMLCGVDKGIQESTCLVITSSKCVLKSKGEVKKKPDSKEQENKEVIKKAFGVEQENIYLQEKNKKAESPVKNEVIKSPKKVSPKKQKEKSQGNIKKTGGNIANMFAKVAQKNLEKPINEKKEEKEPGLLISVEELNAVKSKNNKSSPKMFAKGDQGNAERIKYIHGTEEKNEGCSYSDEDFEAVKPKRSKKSTSKPSPKKTNKSKRRRICMSSDSNDSESSDGDLPHAPVENQDLISTSGAEVLGNDENPTEFRPLNKRKKRKIVDRMVMHEDGYLETKKEVVFETDSDDAEEEQKIGKKNKPFTKLKNITTNTSKKQSSLLTFFKKS